MPSGSADEPPVQGMSWENVEEDILEEQVCCLVAYRCAITTRLCRNSASSSGVPKSPLSHQELKVAFARSRKVAGMLAEALLSLAVSLAMCRCCVVCRMPMHCGGFYVIF
jgi:hypothetical protein